jgi:hypothetical protein
MPFDARAAGVECSFTWLSLHYSVVYARSRCSSVPGVVFVAFLSTGFKKVKCAATVIVSCRWLTNNVNLIQRKHFR